MSILRILTQREVIPGFSILFFFIIFLFLFTSCERSSRAIRFDFKGFITREGAEREREIERDRERDR